MGVDFVSLHVVVIVPVGDPEEAEDGRDEDEHQWSNDRVDQANRREICPHGEDVRPHLMRDGGLEPCLLSWCLRKPRPDKRDVKDTQVLEQDTATETQGLDDQVVEEVVRGFR